VSSSGAGDAGLDEIAWRVLTDLCRPGGEFATLPPEGLQRLISLRLDEEARRAAVAPAALAEAFTRAMVDLTGSGRPPRPAEADDDDEAPETIDDL
jgi:hypothetical protein